MTTPRGPEADDRTDASWLAARRRADIQAREYAVPLLRALEEHLAPGPAHGVDIGTGTGANHTYLTERLTLEIRWTVLDHDPDHLAHPAHADAARVLAGIAELPRLNEDTAARFLTCSAVLDVLRDRDIEALAAVIIDRRLPALFSLSVTGDVAVSPADPLDDHLTHAFNAHQRRDGRLGPDAPRRLAELLPSPWLREARTPWRLRAPADAALLRRYLSERVDAAVDQDPGLGASAARWLERRLRQVEDGLLAVEVGHVDQLVIPSE